VVNQKFHLVSQLDGTFGDALGFPQFGQSYSEKFVESLVSSWVQDKSEIYFQMTGNFPFFVSEIPSPSLCLEEAVSGQLAEQQTIECCQICIIPTMSCLNGNNFMPIERC
jgi:hypothetical protein